MHSGQTPTLTRPLDQAERAISTCMGSIYFWIIVIAIAAWLGIYVW
jgi:hypothetical protein